MNICYISLGLYQGMEWLGHIVSVYLIFERSWQFFLQWLCHFTYSSTVYESSCSWRSSQTLGILSRKNCDVLHRTQNFPIVSKNLSKPHSVQFSSVAQLCLTLCNAMDTHRPPCPSPTPRVYPNSCPSSQWCHPTISSSVIPFPSCPQSFPASFPMSQLFASGGQSTGVSASASVLPMKTQDWSPLGWTGWISSQSTFSSVQFSCSVVSDFLRPHESQHAIPPCSSPTPGAYSNSCPSSRWCHPAISSSVIFFSSCPQSLPASGSFPMSHLFSWGGQSIRVSASTSVLPMNTQDWSPSGWTCWISLLSQGLSRVFSNTTVQKHEFFGTQLSSQSNSHIHTWPLGKPKPWPDGPLLAK